MMLSVRIVTTDHYQAAPLLGLDAVWSEFRERDVKKVPVIRIYGSTPEGQKTCMHIHGVFPYIYVPYDSSLVGEQPSETFMQVMASSLDRALNMSLGNISSGQQHIFKISAVSGTAFYGFHHRESYFMKIYFYSPYIVHRAADLLLNGAVMQRSFQPHEAHVPYMLQFFIDYSLYGMNMITVSAAKFRVKKDKDEIRNDSHIRGSRQETVAGYWNVEALPDDVILDPSVAERMSTCELEVDVAVGDILNQAQVTYGTNPGLLALWTDEKLRRKGKGMSSQVEQPPSQARQPYTLTELEQKWLDRFSDVVSQATVVSEDDHGSLIIYPDSKLEATAVSINEDSVKDVMHFTQKLESMSQSFDQDSLAALLADMFGNEAAADERLTPTSLELSPGTTTSTRHMSGEQITALLHAGAGLAVLDNVGEPLARALPEPVHGNATLLADRSAAGNMAKAGSEPAVGISDSSQASCVLADNLYRWSQEAPNPAPYSPSYSRTVTNDSLSAQLQMTVSNDYADRDLPVTYASCFNVLFDDDSLMAPHVDQASLEDDAAETAEMSQLIWDVDTADFPDDVLARSAQGDARPNSPMPGLNGGSEELVDGRQMSSPWVIAQLDGAADDSNSSSQSGDAAEDCAGRPVKRRRLGTSDPHLSRSTRHSEASVEMPSGGSKRTRRIVAFTQRSCPGTRADSVTPRGSAASLQKSVENGVAFTTPEPMSTRPSAKGHMGGRPEPKLGRGSGRKTYQEQVEQGSGRQGRRRRLTAGAREASGSAAAVERGCRKITHSSMHSRIVKQRFLADVKDQAPKSSMEKKGKHNCTGRVSLSAAAGSNLVDTLTSAANGRQYSKRMALPRSTHLQFQQEAASQPRPPGEVQAFSHDQAPSKLPLSLLLLPGSRAESHGHLSLSSHLSCYDLSKVGFEKVRISRLKEARNGLSAHTLRTPDLLEPCHGAVQTVEQHINPLTSVHCLEGHMLIGSSLPKELNQSMPSTIPLPVLGTAFHASYSSVMDNNECASSATYFTKVLNDNAVAYQDSLEKMGFLSDTDTVSTAPVPYHILSSSPSAKDGFVLSEASNGSASTPPSVCYSEEVVVKPSNENVDPTEPSTLLSDAAMSGSPCHRSYGSVPPKFPKVPRNLSGTASHSISTTKSNAYPQLSLQPKYSLIHVVPKSMAAGSIPAVGQEWCLQQSTVVQHITISVEDTDEVDVIAGSPVMPANCEDERVRDEDAVIVSGSSASQKEVSDWSDIEDASVADAGSEESLLSICSSPVSNRSSQTVTCVRSPESVCSNDTHPLSSQDQHLGLLHSSTPARLPRKAGTTTEVMLCSGRNKPHDEDKDDTSCNVVRPLSCCVCLADVTLHSLVSEKISLGSSGTDKCSMSSGLSLYGQTVQTLLSEDDSISHDACGSFSGTPKSCSCNTQLTCDDSISNVWLPGGLMVADTQSDSWKTKYLSWTPGRKPPSYDVVASSCLDYELGKEVPEHPYFSDSKDYGRAMKNSLVQACSSRFDSRLLSELLPFYSTVSSLDHNRLLVSLEVTRAACADKAPVTWMLLVQPPSYRSVEKWLTDSSDVRKNRPEVPSKLVTPNKNAVAGCAQGLHKVGTANGCSGSGNDVCGANGDGKCTCNANTVPSTAESALPNGRDVPSDDLLPLSAEAPPTDVNASYIRLSATSENGLSIPVHSISGRETRDMNLSLDPAVHRAALPGSMLAYDDIPVQCSLHSLPAKASVPGAYISPCGRRSVQLAQSYNRTTSNIEEASLDNTYGFERSLYRPAEAGADRHHVQHLTIMTVELHVSTRGPVLPNPLRDSVSAIFVHVRTDADSQGQSFAFCCTSSPSTTKQEQPLPPPAGALSAHEPALCVVAGTHSDHVFAHSDVCTQSGASAGELLLGPRGQLSDRELDPCSSASCTEQDTLLADMDTIVVGNQSPLDVAAPSADYRLPRDGRGDIGSHATVAPLGSAKLSVQKTVANLGAAYGIRKATVLDFGTEEEMMLAFADLVKKQDPDILCGWDVQMRSIGYLLQRSEYINFALGELMSRVPMRKATGSNDKTKTTWESTYSTSDNQLRIGGRIILNLWRIMKHQVTLNVYTLENVIYHVLHERLPRFSDEALTKWFDSERMYRWRVLDYYLTRVHGLYRMMDEIDLIGQTSEFARIYGIEFYDVLSRGSQFKVESMMLRLAKPLSYVAVSPSVQQRVRMRAPECIQLTLEPESKFYADPVIVVDFQSLYPSVMIAYNYCYSTCLGRVESIAKADGDYFPFGCTSHHIQGHVLKKLENHVTVSPNGVVFVKQHIRKGILSQMVEEILNTRIMVKQSMKMYSDDKGLQRLLHARQLGLKLIANVTFGYTAANFSGRMPCVEVGDSILRKSRETLESAIKLVENTEKWHARVVYGDTDSMFILLAGRSKDEAFKIGQEIADAVTAANPSPIKLKFEKVYLPCILETKKRYVGYSYESASQQDPTFDAKGIETVRRDGCPAVSKVLEKALRILFETRNVSLVKQYVQRQCTKVLEGRTSLLDFIFAKEYRGAKGYKPGACVPSLEIARRRLAVDPRSEPLVGERVPYVFVYGRPGAPLIELVREPYQLLSCSSLRINSVYYVTKQILPPLGRALSLLGVNVFSWYDELPRERRVAHDTADGRQPDAGGERAHSAGCNTHKHKGTLSQYFISTRCLICGENGQTRLCRQCQSSPVVTAAVLGRRLHALERENHLRQSTCIACAGFAAAAELPCMSLDCSNMSKLIRNQQILRESTELHEALCSW